MLKKLLIVISAFAIILMLAFTYLTARFIDHEEIMRAKIEAQQLKANRDSLLSEVAKRDTLQRKFQDQVSDLRGEAKTLRVQVARLERERAQQQLTVRRLRSKHDLLRKLKEEFPEMAYSDLGVTEVYDEEEDVSIEYLLVPLRFSETFIIDHQNSESYEAQRDKFLQVDSLQQCVIVLQDTIFRLEKENRLAYETGYNEAYAEFKTVNEKYIKLLEKPPQVSMGLGLPNWAWMLGATAGGVFLGTKIK